MSNSRNKISRRDPDVQPSIVLCGSSSRQRGTSSASATAIEPDQTPVNADYPSGMSPSAPICNYQWWSMSLIAGNRVTTEKGDWR